MKQAAWARCQPLGIKCSRLGERGWVRLYDCAKHGALEVDLLNAGEVGLVVWSETSYYSACGELP